MPLTKALRGTCTFGRDVSRAVWEAVYFEVDDRLPFVIRSRKRLSEQMQDMLDAGRRRGEQDLTQKVAQALARSGNAAAFEREMERQDEEKPPRLLSLVR